MARVILGMAFSAFAALTIYYLPLFVQPTLGHIMPSLEHNVVALQPAREVIPRRSDHSILALQVPDDLVVGGLGQQGDSVSAHDINKQLGTRFMKPETTRILDLHGVAWRP